MTTPHRTLQMALDALDAITDDVDGTGLNTMPSFDKALDAIAALREALAAPEPEPVGYISPKQRGLIADPPDESGVYMPMRKTSRGLFTLALYAAPPTAPAPAAPVPDGWVTVPREPTQAMCAAAVVFANGNAVYKNVLPEVLKLEEEIYGEVWSAMIAASPAAPAAPPAAPAPAALLTGGALDMEETHPSYVAGFKAGHAAGRKRAPAVPLTDEQILSMWKSSEFRGKGGQADWFCEGIRAAEAHHGITGASK